MPYRSKILKHFRLLSTVLLGGDLVHQVRHASTFASSLKDITHLFLELLGHPDEPLDAAVGGYELWRTHVITGMSEESWALHTTAHRTGQGRELHARRRFALELAVDGHDAVAHGQDAADDFETAAGSHGILQHGVGVERLYRTLG